MPGLRQRAGDAKAVGVRPQDRRRAPAVPRVGPRREARQALDQFQGRLSGQLVVGGSTIPGEYLLPGLIGQFKGKYPEISISLLIGDSRQVSTWVEDGRAEVGVVGARPNLRTLVS